jgi:hypothetical protein
MADITVQVSSAGLTAYGSQSWGSFSYGGDNQPNITVQTTEAYPEQGWGGQQWGVKLWGNLTDDAAEITGLQLSTSIGNETAEGEINSGWSRLTWGENAWGIAGDVIASGNQLSISFESNQDAWGDLTWSDYNTRWGGVGTVDVGIFNEIPITQNQELNSTTNSVFINIATEVFLSENPLNALTISEGTVDPAPDVMPSGIQINSNVGTVQAYNEQGWGRDDWGTEVWGAEGEWAFVRCNCFRSFIC